MPALTYTVYGLTDPRTNALCYVGCTRLLRRRLREHWSTHGYRITPHDVVSRELKAAGLRFGYEVFEEFKSAEDAYVFEHAALGVARSLGCSLLNRATGGRHNSVPKGDVDRYRMAVAKGGRPFVDQHGRRYLTIKGAARELGLDANKICSVLKGRRRITKGYVFRYADAAR